MQNLARVMTALILAVTTLLPGTSCASRSNSAPGGDTGLLQMPLTTTAGGATYRLVDVRIQISAPNFPSQVLVESDPSEAAVSIDLPTGTYTLSLTQWSLQRSDGQGNYATAVAALESNPTQSATIFNGTTTTVTYSFVTAGVVVTVGSGHLGIGFRVDLADAACTPFGEDCPSGSWCPPASLRGADLTCVSSGSVAVGQSCQNPGDCVANASCFASAGRSVCAALCPSDRFNLPCSSGGQCQPVASDYGFCDTSDGGASVDGAPDAGVSTVSVLEARGGLLCYSCAVPCMSATSLAEGTCENPPSDATAPLDRVHTYTEVCLEGLQDILDCPTHSPYGGDCLCGTGCVCSGPSSADCSSVNGSAAPAYIEDVGPGGGPAFLSEIDFPEHGYGRASLIARCLVARSCSSCFR